MSVRFISSWNGYQPGDVDAFAAPVEAALIAGLLARDAMENDSAMSDFQAVSREVEALRRVLPLQFDTLDFANDAAAEAALVPIGGLYHTAGAVKVRVA